MRVLIFYYRVASLPDLWRAFPNAIVPTAQDSYDRRFQHMESFRKSAVSVMLVNSGWATGWRAPEGTIVLFHSDFPDGPLRAQAEARIKL